VNRIQATFALLAILFIAMPTLATAGDAIPRTPSKPVAELAILSPADGASVTSPVKVVFGLSGMGVAPAGVNYPGTGHHHLIVDAKLPPADRPIPADANHIHFGGGQTEVELDLPPGKHTLQLILGDANHVPHDPPVTSKAITITVK
jgi:hypothetical protein